MGSPGLTAHLLGDIGLRCEGYSPEARPAYGWNTPLDGGDPRGFRPAQAGKFDGENAPPIRWGVWVSILFRQERAGGTAVGLGDDPEADAVGGDVGGEQAVAGAQRLVVGLAVVEVEVTPVTAQVAGEGEQDLVGGHLGEDTGGG